ncbi:MAG: FG-GAP-like repeat-containing protein [Minisyncoccia bacterium]
MKTKRMLLVVAFATLNFQFLNTLKAQVSFSSPATFAVGGQPFSPVSADFNGDGNLDLAATNNNSNDVQILLGNGTGGFGAASSFIISSYSVSITSADFNGDGKADLATANQGSNSVSVLFGNGLGGFDTATNFTVGSGPIWIINTDLNGDGKVDLVIVNQNSNNVSVLMNDSTGGFGIATNFLVGSNPYSVTSADFNGDGKADLATVNQGANNVSILLGDSTGGFGIATNFSVGTSPMGITSADFNGDGKIDLVTANSNNNNVSILLGTGSGSFSSAINFLVGTTPFSISNADFNGDGKIDLVTANQGSNDVSILLGNGTGSFGTTNNFSACSSPRSVICADFNGDGNIDLSVGTQYSNNISILFNTSLPTSAPICLITVDPTNTHNVIVWEKSSLNLAPIDSFIVYREISTNDYQQIGAVSKDSLSVFNDIVNPSTTGYRYKLKVKNTSGISSNFSSYHNTIYLTNIGPNFSWTPYQVENNTTPVANYNVYRDDSLSGVFNLIGNTTGNQFGYTDVNFSSFPYAQYYVEAVMVSGSCFPTRSGFGTARSNIKGFGITGLQELPFAKVKVYPNPTRDILNIEGITDKTILHLYDVVGKLVMEKEVENNTTINTSELVDGIYTLSTETKGGRIFNKIVVNH